MNHYAARFFLPAKKAMPLQAAGTRRKIAQVRMQLACAEDLFNFVTDEDMLDSCIYQLNSLQLYYGFLMRQVRQEELWREDPRPETVSPLLEARPEGMVESMG